MVYQSTYEYQALLVDNAQADTRSIEQKECSKP